MKLANLSALAKSAPVVAKPSNALASFASSTAREIRTMGLTGQGTDQYFLVALRNDLAKLVAADQRLDAPLAAQQKSMAKLVTALGAQHASRGNAATTGNMARLQRTLGDYAAKRLTLAQKASSPEALVGEVMKLNKTTAARMPAFGGFSSTDMSVGSLGRSWQDYLRQSTR